MSNEAKRILIVSDAWRPQVNGVVRTLEMVTGALKADGLEVEVIGPDRFRSMPAPSYPEIRLALFPKARLTKMIDDYAPDAVHIATEGPLGWAARGICKKRGWPFTTSFHTKFPEYMQARTGIPAAWSWAVLRRFHEAGVGTFVATKSLAEEMTLRGFTKLIPWSRGVDLKRFNPEKRDPWEGLERPIFLYAGRVAIEKNIEAFLALDLPGTKVVVGEGPARQGLMEKFPKAHYTGYRDNGKLAASYAGADVFVFPSRTDTFGLVLLEALAAGTPVAAYPVTGPKDVIGDQGVGALDEDLRAACLRALTMDRAHCRRYAEGWSWEECARRFRTALVKLR
ncbi:glycosyltransferase family 1 protein [Acetobacteraceae bacterium H6797]|nr:glycosyltransferase family 1 protein [Acetobacteraceae bacterium H6797]